MFVRTSICTYVHICVYIYIYVCEYIFLYVYVYPHIHICICIYAYANDLEELFPCLDASLTSPRSPHTNNSPLGLLETHRAMV